MVFLIDTKLGFLPTPHLAGKYAVVRTPAGCTGACGAQTVDSNLSTIHAQRIEIGTHPSHLGTVQISTCKYRHVCTSMY